MTISLKPSEKTADLMEEVRRWSVDVVRPHAREADRTERFPDLPEVIKASPLDVQPSGFAGLAEDEFIDRARTMKSDIESGANVLSVFMCDPLSQGDSWAWQLLYGGAPAEDFIRYVGTPEQIEQWCSGDRVLTAIAMTEEQSGTDLGGIETVAVRDGDEWVLNGKKVFISSALECEFIVLLATVDPAAGSKGVRSFVLDRDDVAKFHVTTSKEDKIGFRFMRSATFELHDLRIPADRCIGGDGVSGVGTAMQLFSKNRATCSTWGPSIAKGCLEYVRGWVAEHVHEFSPERLAKIERDFVEMTDALDDVIRLALKAAWQADRGEKNTLAVSHAKAVAPKLAESVVGRCLQLMGAEGASELHLMEKWFRDVKMTDAVLGPGQINRRTAALILFGRAAA